MTDNLKHYGILRESYDYPWGHGRTSEERGRKFLELMEELREKRGMNESGMARWLNMSVEEFRTVKTIAKDEVRKARKG
jgi:hypothetical protein